MTLHGADEEELAAAELRFSTDAEPGFDRNRHGKGFAYRRADGSLVRSARDRARIKALVIPPAWEDVWICTDARGHLQATGLDDRGRRQYLYHKRWREVRDASKFDQMLAFADALPAIRKRVDADVQRPGIGRDKVLATVVRLLETTLIRVGNAEYATSNGSYGLTTLRRRHVNVQGAEVRFRFTGKSGKQWDLATTDRRIARVVRQCSDLPGYELFAYRDDGGDLVDVDSSDVNAYLRESSSQEFTAKDFRTWAGTVLAAEALDRMEPANSERDRKKAVAASMREVAQRLGNTPATCRKSYVHPALLDAYMSGEFGAGSLSGKGGKRSRGTPEFSSEERAVLEFLRDRVPG